MDPARLVGVGRGGAALKEIGRAVSLRRGCAPVLGSGAELLAVGCDAVRRRHQVGPGQVAFDGSAIASVVAIRRSE
jgi:hypothetical protein